MTTYTNSNGAIVADDTALAAIPSTNLLVTTGETVLLYNAFRGRWTAYDPDATSGDITPIDSPTNGRWFFLGSETLRSNRTYYVRSDGSDSNNGLANTSGGAFLTIAKAIGVASNLKLNGYTVTIQLQNGTWSLGSSYIAPKSYEGDGLIVIQGNTSDATQVTITGTNANGLIQAYGVRGLYSFQYLTFTNTGNGHGINAQSGSQIHYANCIFGSLGTGWATVSTSNAIITNLLNGTGYPSTISGNMSGFLLLFVGGVSEFVNATLTLSGTPAFGSAFALVLSTSCVNTNGLATSGSATGTRYNVQSNAVLASGGATLPGNAAGTTSTGGQYV